MGCIVVRRGTIPSMRVLVDMGLLFGALVTAPWWLIRMVALGKHRTDWAARFGRTAPLGSPSGRRILLHAVSVGEVGAIRGLVAALGKEDGVEIVVASTTDTGYARATELFGADHQVVRSPRDFSWSVARFLRSVQPTVVGLVELEVWPNMTAACARKGVPTVVVSGRLSSRSFARYKLIRPLVRPMFRRLAAVGAQTQDVADRFVALGATRSRVRVTGNMKWDSVPVHGSGDPAVAALAADLGIDLAKPVLVGGSTAPGEEVLLRDACPDGVQLVCAPRRPEWWDSAAAELAPCVRRSSGTTEHSDTGRFVLDTIGELSAAYGFADVVVVGRSFGALHGSDPVEPLARGAAVVIGPAVADFQETVQVLRDGGGVIQCEAAALAGVLEELFRDADHRARLVQQGAKVLEAQRGSTQSMVTLLLRASQSDTAA